MIQCGWTAGVKREYPRAGVEIFGPRLAPKRRARTWGTEPFPKPCALDVDHRDQFFYGGGAFVEGHFLFWSEFDLDDLLDSFGA